MWFDGIRGSYDFYSSRGFDGSCDLSLRVRGYSMVHDFDGSGRDFESSRVRRCSSGLGIQRI